MSFNIKIPYVVATHLKKFAANTSLKNKSKAGAIGFIGSAAPYTVQFNDGSVARTVVDTSTAQTLSNKTLTAPSVTESINASGAGTVQLTAAQSGQTFLFDANTGIVYTLPAAAVGLTFMFLVTVTVTSNSHKVITKNGTELLIGSLILGAGDNVTPGANPGPKYFSGNNSTHIAVTQNSASSNATGGIIGSWVQFTCLSTTQWFVQGNVECGSGATIATPFATS